MKAAASTVLISEADIQRRVAELGRQISEDYHDQDLTLVGVLNGCFVFMADLVRQIDPSILLEVEFVSVSSYGDRTVSSGQVRVDRDIRHSLEGKEVLLVEGIVDSGRTLKAVMDLIKSRNPNSLRVAALLDKQTTRPHPVVLDYVGFQIPDAFVVGYGLDFAQHYRNLKEIRILDGQ
jgi:hypoxanthine phosphoribosyltransferase